MTLLTAVLEEFTLRASLKLKKNVLNLSVYQYGKTKPYMKIVDTYPNQLKRLHADIRFFPRRKRCVREFAN